MQMPLWEHISRIESQLTDDSLVYLVAVFSKLESDNLLLVYLPGAKPEVLPEHAQAVTLDDLRRWDLQVYDGPIVAFSEVDIVRPDIPTKGPAFYGLDHVLRERELWSELRFTWSALSRYLLDLFDDPDWSFSNAVHEARAIADIVSLAAPAILERVPRQDLVALIPDPSLEAYVEAGACDLIYRCEPPTDLGPGTVRVHSLEALGDPEFVSQERIIALPEIQPDQEQTDKRLPLELRKILKKSGLDDALNETLGGLALDFYSRWKDTQSPEDLETAYALGVERWLTGVDVDDLVGVLPCDDFHRFVAEGAAIHLYRQLPEQDGQDAGQAVRRLRFQEITAATASPDGYSQVAFALLPLCKPLQALELRWCSLGSILYKVGRADALARSAWLLVSDLMGWFTEERRRDYISLTHLFQTITQSCELFSLENPWRWRHGRRNHMVAGAYETLSTVLDRRTPTAKELEQIYYKALNAWYGFAQRTDEDIEPALRKMVTLLGKFDRGSRHRSDVDEKMKQDARDLQTYGQALLLMLGGGGQPEIIREEFYPEGFQPTFSNVPHATYMAADMKVQTKLPSLFFRDAFQRYAEIMEDIQRISTSQIPVEDRITRLRQKVADLEQAQRIVFALFHEEKILHLLYQRAIERTRAQADELQGSAQFHVQLLTPTLAQHEQNELTFLARNIGRVEATDISVELSGSPERFRLEEASSVRSLREAVPPDGETRFQFTVSPRVDDGFSIQVEISYRDLHREPQTHRQEFLVKVTSLDRGPFRRKRNPYVYGDPLQDHRDFYGRRLELDSLLNHLASGRPQNILVRGARRTGKTSILYMVEAIIEDHQGHGEVRSWFDVPTEWYTSLDALQSILLDLSSIDRPDDTMTPSAFYRAVLTEISNVGLRSPEIDDLLSESRITADQFGRALDTTLREYHGRRLVVLLDEFDVLDLIADKDFYAKLRHVISSVQTVTWIIASALGLYKEVSDYESPLFNVFKIIDLKPLDRAAARHLILDPWSSSDEEEVGEHPVLQFMDDAVDAILYETGRHPYFIQLLCSEIVDHVNAVRTNYVLHGTVYDVIDKMIAPRSAVHEHFGYLWDHAGGVGKIILLLLLRNVEALTGQELWEAWHHHLNAQRSDVPTDWVVSKFEDSLRRLQAVEALALDDRNRLVFGIPLFRRLLAERRGRENLEETIRQEMRAEFVRGRQHA